MEAVHIGAGNIGRGFIGLLLHQAGYDLTLTDIDPALIDRINTHQAWQVRELGPGGKTHQVHGVRAINSATNPEAAITAMARADVITTAVGASTLAHIGKPIAKALQARDPHRPRVLIMACENAIRATDVLRDAVAQHTTDLDRAYWANTAVDRIVPAQRGDGLDVDVEPYCEWVIELAKARRPTIPRATMVDDLSPFIERKLFTVNTGHCALAWVGYRHGHTQIGTALADPVVREVVEAVLEETSALLVAKYPTLSASAQAAYVQQILARFANPELSDTIGRVGRSPLRKLGPNERVIAPICQASERGLPIDALLSVVSAGLDFRADGDNEVEELHRLLVDSTPEAFVQTVMGVTPDAPAFARLVGVTIDFDNPCTC